MQDEKLTKDRLQTAEAVLSLGLIIVKELTQSKVATVFINDKGEVELAPKGEIDLDGLPQDTALEILLDRGYADEQLMAYMLGRKAREALTNE